MQHITKIEIKNFKSIQHQIIDDCRRINVFIGYPNVGKSNILEALSLGTYLNNKSNSISFKNLCRFKELIDIFKDGDKTKPCEINIDDFLIHLKYIDKHQLISTIGIATGIFPSVFNKEFKIDKEGKIDITDSRNNLSDKPAIKKYQFVGIDATVQSDEEDVLNQPFGTNLAEIIRHDNNLRRECGELLANYHLKLIFDENENIIIQKQLDEFSAFQFSISQVADTLQRLIFYKAAIASNQNSVLLFEEPEAHMFPPYIKKITSDIIFDKNDNQYFIATHSPYVLDEFMADAADELAVYLVDYKDGETKIIHLSDDELAEIRAYGVDLFFNIESYLNYGQVNNA